MSVPSEIVEVIDRAAAEMMLAVIVFVDGFTQMRVARAIVLVCEIHRFAHQMLRHGEWRARCERNLQHRALGPVVIAVQHPLAIGQNFIVAQLSV